MAEKNASEYGLTSRVVYRHGNAQKMPFDDESFNGVFSHGSLHEWENPTDIFDEIFRVLKPGGFYRISDLRRDMSILIRWFIIFVTKPKEIRAGLKTSINAAYIVKEINNILVKSNLKESKVRTNPFGLEIFGQKSG